MLLYLVVELVVIVTVIVLDSKTGALKNFCKKCDLIKCNKNYFPAFSFGFVFNEFCFKFEIFGFPTSSRVSQDNVHICFLSRLY